jgi:competence protein ComEC
VVASGYNVMVVSGVILFILTLFVSRFTAIPFLLLGIFFYSLIAGADPPIIRSAVMGGMAFTAQVLGKEYQGMWALGVVSVLMLLVSPIYLFDVSFQLSVAATAGILLFSPIFRKIFFLVNRNFVGSIIEGICVTLAAQVAVQPLIFYHFQSVSLISPVVNVLVAPLIPIIMAMGGMLTLSFILPRLITILLSQLTLVPLTFFVWLIDTFAKVPYGYVEFSKLNIYWMIVSYGCLIGLYLFSSKLLNKL